MSSCAAEDGADRARQAFERAVTREYAAIKVHERAARLHEELAARLDETATAEARPVRSPGLSRRAAAERARAGEACQRADAAQGRLVAEGAAQAS